MQTLITSFH